MESFDGPYPELTAHAMSECNSMVNPVVALQMAVRLGASKNSLLSGGCCAMQGYNMGRYGYGEGGNYGNRYGELQTSGSAPTRPFDRYGSSGGMQVSLCAQL